MPPDTVEEAPDERIGGEAAKQLRLGAEIGEEESEEWREDALEEKGADDDEKPGQEILEEKQRAVRERNAGREDASGLKMPRIGEIVFGKGGDDDGRDNGEDDPAGDEKGGRDAREERLVR